jgi:AraC-like DNA-binding protein
LGSSTIVGRPDDGIGLAKTDSTVAPSSGLDAVRAGMRSVSFERYRLAPAGCYISLRHTMAFCVGPALWGFSAWGAPRREEIEQLVSFVMLDLAADVPPHATLVDMRGLEIGDLSAFAPLIEHASSHHELAATKVMRMAVVRPPGLLGMTVAGFCQVVTVPYPVRIFADVLQAADWVGASPQLGASLDSLLQSERTSGPSLAQLRAWLDNHVADATLTAAAHALARSRRSLQRDLQLAGSSFRAELFEARARRAKTLLLHTGASLTEIAYEVGCASLQHFSIMFRSHTGKAPSQWREQQRSDPAVSSSMRGTSRCA